MAHRFFAGLLTLGLLSSAAPGTAEISFDAMPVGCSWTTRYSDGKTNTETYLGLQSGKHRTKVTEASDPEKIIRYSQFNRKGRLVRKDWQNGKWEEFSPFSCFDSKGSCTYVYTNADGFTQRIASETRATGKGFSVKAGPVGGAPYPDEYFEVGDFGLMTKNKSSNYSARLVNVNNCGIGS